MAIAIVLRWWYLPIVLAIIPFIYGRIRKPSGDWDMQIDTMLIAAICWFSSVGVLIGHWL